MSHLTSYGYDQYQNQISRQDALNHTTQYGYDALNRKTSETTPLGKVTQYEYDANGNITKTTDANNQATTYEYDALNHLTKTTYPNSTTATYTYDDRGNMLTMVNTTGTTTYAYDSLNRVTSETDPNNSLVSYAYDANNNITQVTYPGNKQVNYTYDGANRLTKVSDWNNSQTTYQYNANGSLASKTLPNGIQALYTYDTGNRLSNLQYAKNGQLISNYAYTRDVMGNVTNAAESTPTTPQSYTIFDEALRTGWSKSWSWDSTISLTDTTAPNTGTKDISWKISAAWGGIHLRSTTGLVDTTPYNTLSFAMKAAGGGAHDIAVFLHDANDNNLGTEVDLGIYGGNPNTSGYITYNIPLSALNGVGKQISAISFEDVAGIAQTKLYVDDIKLTTTTPSVITLYDDARAPGIANWSWGATNNFADTTAPYSGTNAIGTTFTAPYGGLLLENSNVTMSTTGYDFLSFALKGSQAGQSFVTQMTDANGNGIGQEINIAQYGGNPNSNDYTLYNIPISAFQLPSPTIGGFYISNDTAQAQPKILVDAIKLTPHVATQTTTTQTTFGYDALSRLISATYPTGSYTYTYDAVGNRLTSNENGTQSTYTINNDNQTTAKGTRSFTYDSKGNQVADGAKTLGYTPNNLLSSIVNGGQTYGYKYDAAGNRIQKTTNGTATYNYVNDTVSGLSKVLLATNASTNAQTYYVYGDNLLSQGGAAATSRQYYLSDGLGNVRAITDNNGNNVQAYTYDPYGNRLTGNTTTDFQYQGERFDSESGLTYLRARYYDPSSGHFLSRDPVSGTLNNPQTQNGYSYASNNPVNMSDPSGNFSMIIPISLQVGGGLMWGGSGAIAISSNGDFGLLGSTQISGTYGGSAGADIGLQFSNASSFCELGGIEYFSGGSIGEVFEGSFEYSSSGIDPSSGRYIYSTGVGVGLGVNGSLTGPDEVHIGAGKTWTWNVKDLFKPKIIY